MCAAIGVVTSKSKYRNSYAAWTAQPEGSEEISAGSEVKKIGVTFPPMLTIIRAPLTTKLLHKFRLL